MRKLPIKKTLSRLRHLRAFFGPGTHKLQDVRLAFGILKSTIARWVVGPGDWKPTYLDETTSTNLSKNTVIGVFVHVHFSENLPELVEALECAPFQYKLFVSSSRKEVLDEFGLLASARGINCTSALVSNQGRNFFPLLAAFKDDIMKFEVALHLHTKNSGHSKGSLGDAWRRILWKSLILDAGSARRFVQLMSADKAAAIAYPDVSSLIRPINFCWGQSLSAAQTILRKINFASSNLNQEYFAFPAGGMMYFRPVLFAELFDYPWSEDDFPSENGQIDGTTQHALERLFGYLASQKELKHIIYDPDKDRFTNEETYTSRR